MSVREPEDVLPAASRIVREAGGYVEESATRRDANVWLVGRVPAQRLEAVMDSIAALGDEQRRSVSTRDVTEETSDLETRIRNAAALRDRLRQLLARARDVEDVLAIEKELARVQSEVESMQARLERLESQVELSALSVTLQRERVLGPLGYVGYGLWWVVSKLFVIR